jgi:hexosaminidase
MMATCSSSVPAGASVRSADVDAPPHRSKPRAGRSRKLALTAIATLAVLGAADGDSAAAEPSALPAALPLWPALNADTGKVSAGQALAAAAKALTVRCVVPDGSRGCPSPEALAWYERRVRADGSSAAGAEALNRSVVSSVTVDVAAAERSGMGVRTDESYVLSCSSARAGGECKVSANSTVGAVRGLETLAHLAHAQHIPLPLQLFDEPRFPYRGLLIDSARHFLSVGSIKRILDAMSMTKLSVLHWHLSDTTSFPVQSEAFPQLSQLGAFHPSLVYTKANLTELVAYAAQRGVRIVPEFDLPGHSSFPKSMPHLVIPCAGALDPTLDATYSFLRTFLKEMTEEIFPDPYLALGGDEVGYSCAAEVKKGWLAAHNMTAVELLPYFWQRVSAEVMPALNRTLYVWGTTHLQNLDPSITPEGSVFNLYTALDASLNVTAKRGVPGVLSAPYYLDQTMSYRGNAHYSPQSYRHCGTDVHQIDAAWMCFYSTSPTWGVLDAALARNRSLVLGGESCIWGEATSEDSIETQSLTYASAAAERFWTGNGVPQAVAEQRLAFAEAGGRLGQFVCLLNRQGLRASPVSPGFCLRGARE